MHLELETKLREKISELEKTTPSKLNLYCDNIEGIFTGCY